MTEITALSFANILQIVSLNDLNQFPNLTTAAVYAPNPANLDAPTMKVFVPRNVKSVHLDVIVQAMVVKMPHLKTDAVILIT